jgi:hypothetical protein
MGNDVLILNAIEPLLPFFNFKPPSIGLGIITTFLSYANSLLIWDCVFESISIGFVP